MIKVMFVCHGNICRSPMAEFVFKDMVKKSKLSEMFYIASSATSTEEIGNSVHPGTKHKLKEHGISSEGKTAVRLQKEDYKEYNYLIGMDSKNIFNMNGIFGYDSENKIHKLLDFSDHPGDIADPWYTGDFDLTYSDVVKGCGGLLKYILDRNN